MIWLLGKAVGPDPTDSNLTIILIAMSTAAAVFLLAAIPVTFARRRNLGKIEAVAALMIAWGLIAAGSIVYSANAQLNYSREYTMRITLNFDPAEQGDRPKEPWTMWGCLAAVYGGVIIWSTTAKSATARGFPIDPG